VISELDCLSLGDLQFDETSQHINRDFALSKKTAATVRKQLEKGPPRKLVQS